MPARPVQKRKSAPSAPPAPSPAEILAALTLAGCRADIDSVKGEIARLSRDLAALRTLEKILIERDGDFAAPLAGLSLLKLDPLPEPDAD